MLLLLFATAGVDVTAPTADSATIGASGVSVTVQCSETVSVGAGGNGGFTVSLSGGAATLTYASGSGSGSLVYNISRTVYSDETGTISYTQPGDGIEDASGNDLATFADLAITNNSSQVLDVTAPTFSSAAIATDGDSISIVLSEAVEFGAGSNTGFTLATNGAAVTLSYTSGTGTDTLVYATSRTISDTETLTLTYVQPGNGVQDAAGNDLASFSAQAVTNSSTVNGAPTDISLSSSSVLTTAGLNAVVGTLSATDPDAGDTHTFTLVAGTGDTDNASFNISGASLRCGDPSGLTPGAYSVRIQAADSVTPTPNTYAEAFEITVVEPGGGSLYEFNSFLSGFRLRF